MTEKDAIPKRKVTINKVRSGNKWLIEPSFIKPIVLIRMSTICFTSALENTYLKSAAISNMIPPRRIPRDKKAVFPITLNIRIIQ